MSRRAKLRSAPSITLTVPARLSTATISRWVSQARRRLAAPPGDLSIVTVSPPRSRQLNRQYRHRDYATNVLSFSFSLSGQTNTAQPWRGWGEIVLCPTVIRRQAGQWSRTYRQHFRALLEHGLLHLLGYDHRTTIEQRRWNRLEKKLHAHH